MPKYQVIDPLSHNQKDYFAGDTVELTEEQAAALLPVGVIVEAKPEGGRLPGAAADMIALVKQAATQEELEQLAEGETRKTVLDAVAARAKELGGN